MGFDSACFYLSSYKMGRLSVRTVMAAVLDITSSTQASFQASLVVVYLWLLLLYSTRCV